MSNSNTQSDQECLQVNTTRWFWRGYEIRVSSCKGWDILFKGVFIVNMKGERYTEVTDVMRCIDYYLDSEWQVAADLEDESKDPEYVNGRDPVVLNRVRRWGKGLMNLDQSWPSFACELRDEYLRHTSISLQCNHPQFEARKSFLRKQGFEYCVWLGAWFWHDPDEPVESVTNEIDFDLRTLDFQNMSDSPIDLEGADEDTIRIFLNGQFLGEVETSWDCERNVFYWGVVLVDDPRGNLEIRDPRAIVKESRRWAEAHPNPSVETFALHN